MTGIQALHPFINSLATALEVAGVLVLVGGVVLASITFLREKHGGLSWRDAYERYRSNLGRGIPLGLEFLVGADIIEIEGCWPWERARHAGSEPDRER